MLLIALLTLNFVPSALLVCPSSLSSAASSAFRMPRSTNLFSSASAVTWAVPVVASDRLAAVPAKMTAIFIFGFIVLWFLDVADDSVPSYLQMPCDNPKTAMLQLCYKAAPRGYRGAMSQALMRNR